MAHDESLAQRFAAVQAPLSPVPAYPGSGDAADEVMRIFNRHAVDCASNIVDIALNAPRLEQQLSASKFVVRVVLPRETAAGGEDPLTKFMNQVATAASTNN